MRVDEIPVSPVVRESIKKVGIEALYPPQEEAIKSGLLDGESLLVASSTASGKTLLAVLASVKAYELLTVEAAVHGDRKAAYQALLVHPLGPSADRVQVVLDDLLKTNKAYLPRFWR